MLITRTQLGTGKNPLELYRSMKGSGDSYFFKTINHVFMGFQPLETIRIKNGRAQIQNSVETIILSGNPYKIVTDRIKKYSGDSTEAYGHVFGYFSYDSVRFLEPTILATQGNLNSINGSHDCEFFIFQNVIEMNSKNSIVVKQLSLNSQPKEDLFLQTVKHHAHTNEHYQSRSNSSIELSMEEMHSMFGKKEFIENVKKLKNHIRAGDIFQAVLSEKLQTVFKGDSIDLFNTLANGSPATYQYFLQSGSREFLGASPEMLVKIENGTIETHPIAGTRPRGTTFVEEKNFERQLLRSTKENSEHLMLVDLARNDLGKISESGSVHVENFREIKKFGGVMHLVSRVLGKIKKEIHPIEALAACFPAGTLSGAPKVRAMEILSSIEPENRGFYGGAVVIADLTGNLDSCITIRSIQIENSIATVQAGAGIVMDSNPSKEYAEIQFKTKMTRTALGTLKNYSVEKEVVKS